MAFFVQSPTGSSYELTNFRVFFEWLHVPPLGADPSRAQLGKKPFLAQAHR